MTTARWITLTLVAAVLAAFFYFDLGQYLTIAQAQAQRANLVQLLGSYPLEFTLIFFWVYVLATAISLPGAAVVLTLLAGAVFGLWWGVLLVSFASTLGATLAMVLARWLFRAQVERRFVTRLAAINKGMEEEGAFYLFTLRLVPLFPFFAINLAMGLTKISVPLYFIVSQAGMLAGTIVYVNAGTELGQLTTAADILSPRLIGAFAALGLFPLVAKRLLGMLRKRRVYKGYKKPRAFDMDLVVLGAGSGGLVAALIAATVKAKVTLIEKDKMGGDCLNTGCVPSKALIRTARLAFDSGRAGEFGLTGKRLGVDFASVMQRVHEVIARIAPHDSVERYEGLGVKVEEGEGRLLDPWRVQVNDKVITTRYIIIATGASPFIPPIGNIDSVEYLTSDNLWSLETLPPRALVLGGGPIGTELTQALNRLGSQVTQVELLPRLLPREDEEFSQMVKAQLEAEGVTVLTDHSAEAVEVRGDNKLLICQSKDGGRKELPFDALLVAVGRKAQVQGFGLEQLGVAITNRGTVGVDSYLRTNYPNIFAIGDAAGPYQFTHTASHTAWYATVNALFGSFWKFKVDYSVIPWVTFCSPEVARVGLNEMEAKEQGIPYEVTTYQVGSLDRAATDRETTGLVKVLTKPGSDRILGATIAADHAGDLIAEFTLAMKHNLGLGKLLGTVHAYPTWMEMNKFAASEWRKAHKPEWALTLVEKYHRLRRGKPPANSPLQSKERPLH